MTDERRNATPPKLGQKYAYHWFNTTPHGVYELAHLIDAAIEEAWNAALDSTQARERELRDLAAALEGEIIDAHAYANDPSTTSWNHMLDYLRCSMKLAAQLREKLSTTQPRGDV